LGQFHGVGVSVSVTKVFGSYHFIPPHGGMLSLAAEFAVSGGQCSRTAEKLEGTASAVPKKIFGRVGAKSEGMPPGVPKSFSVVQEHDPPVKAKNGSEWRMATGD
jgi:hypothetical protein